MEQKNKNAYLVSELATRLHTDEEYVSENISIALDVVRHNGDDIDFDWVTHLSELLGFHIPYSLYLFIDTWFAECGMMDLGESDIDELWRCVNFWIDTSKPERKGICF